MSEQRAERIRQWHEGAYRQVSAITGSGQTISYLGRTLVMMPQIMPITPMSHLLGEAVLAEVKGDDGWLVKSEHGDCGPASTSAYRASSPSS